MGRSRSRSRSRDKKKYKDHKDRKEKKRSYSKERKEKNHQSKNDKYEKKDNQDKPLRERTDDKGTSATGTVENSQQKVDKLWVKMAEEKQAEQESLLKVQQKYGIVKKAEHQGPVKLEGVSSYNPVMIEVIINDRLGKKERIKCLPSDTIGILKKLIQAKTGTRADKIKLQKWHQVFKDHITLEDYEIHDGMSLEMYYN